MNEPPHQSLDTTATVPLLQVLADDLRDHGYAIAADLVPPTLVAELWQYLRSLPQHRFHPAGVGREEAHTLRSSVRTDTICWLTGSSAVEAAWLTWTGQLQRFLNRQLFLGLGPVESHFAYYGPGTYYRRHVDAFRGQANRLVSLVLYLNPEWQPGEGGELVLFTGRGAGHEVRIAPVGGTLVVFLSEEIPHEVLPARRDRYSIAGWFSASNRE